MLIQKQSKVKVFGAAMILGAMFVCSIAAFAAVTASTTLLQFPNQTVGTKSATMSVTISNTSRQSVTIESASVSTAQFSYSGPAFPITLREGQSFTGSVTFTPTAAQAYSGKLTFTRFGTDISVKLTGAGTAAVVSEALTASANALSFSAQAGAAAPATQSLTIGDSPASAVPYTVTADQAWISLSATSGTTSSAIQVGAKTAGLAAGNYTGHVIVSASGVTNSPMSVTVTLAVTAASTSPYVLRATPSSLSFSGAVGSSPACQSMDTLDTTPAGPLPVAMSTDVAWLTVTPTFGQTELNISACTKTAGLAAGTFTGHVVVTMTGPNNAGQTVNNSPYLIPVTLVITGAQSSTLTATPSAMAFSAVVGGTAPAKQSLTIGNSTSSAVPFTVTADQAWLTLSAASGTTSSTIQVGANTSGLAAGNYTGHVITTATGVTNSPMSVTVTLAVTAAQTNLLTVNPTSLAFGNINLANNNTKTVTLTNSGTGSVTISQINVLGLGISVNGVATPMTLAAGQTTVLSIIYSPSLLGIVAGSITVVSNATNSPAVILATGTGVQPQITASPASLSFGSVAVGSSGTKTITVSNTGTAAATISQAVVSGTGYTISGPAMPMTLAAGASTSFSVQFAPTAAGTDSGSVTVTSNTPNSPTMVATSGTGTAAVAHSVSLSWVASTSSTAVGYNIYRGSVSGGPYTVLNSTPQVSLSFTDTSVLGGQTYYYVVTAVDATGTESVQSNEAAVIIPTP
jgi:ASPM-SPD-2-Hydin domain-containing protein/BACON domain-containing protein/centrosomal CEP192-like protein